MELTSHDVIIQELCSLLSLERGKLDYDASFPANGGNSLSAIKWSSLCKKKGFQLEVNTIISSQSLFDVIQSAKASPSEAHCLSDSGTRPLPIHEGPEGSKQGTWDWLDQIETTGVDFRVDLQTSWGSFDLTSEQDDNTSGLDSTNTDPSIYSEIDMDHFAVPASEMQLTLIHGSVKNPGTNIIQYFETYEPEHIPSIKDAWHTLYEQESILGIRYSADLLPQKRTCFDWRAVTTEDRKEFEKLINTRKVPLDIGSSWQVVTLAAPGQPSRMIKSVVIWTIHHALIDGYSAQLLLSKIRRIVAGEPVSPGPSPVEMTRRIQMLREARNDEGSAFWAAQRDLLNRATTALQLPPPLEASPVGEDFAEVEIHVSLSNEVLNAIARECSITPATIYYAAWALVLTVLADSDEVVFGVALSGRNLPVPGIEDAIGAFVNSLPLAISLSNDVTLSQLLLDTFKRMYELSEYQWTVPENGFSRTFQTALYMQYNLRAGDEVCAVRPIDDPYFRQTSQTPLSVLIFPDRGSVCLQYKTSDFHRSHIESLARLYQQAMKAFTRLDMSLRTVQSSLVTPEARQELREYGNCLSALTTSFSVTDDLVTLFESSADQCPDASAIEKGDTTLSYRQADHKAGVIASTLIKYGVQPGDIVCVDADRSVNWIISIFGVLKTSAAYCALDWELPSHLRSLMFNQTGAKVFLASEESAAARAPDECQLVITVESLFAAAKGGYAAPGKDRPFPRRQRPTPGSTAYVCFTSGSTGTPKGVMCSHEGLVAFQRDLEVRLFAQPGIRVSQVMSPAFDGSIHEIFSALCHGATIVLPEGDNVFQALDRANSAILTPSVAAVLEPDDYPLLKYVYLVGEPVKKAVNDRWGASKMLYNMYGPTEGTGGATIKRLLPHETVTIGHPNPSTRVYILGSRGQIVPPGMMGELYIAGVQVARGYLGMPGLTAERFLPDPFHGQDSSEFMYRTGDRGYWLPSGEIVCLGRSDRQIKLRGFRLDLNDLEIRVAQAVPGIKAVAISPRHDFLVAAFQPKSLDNDMVAAVLTNVLPVYAQPRHVVFVDEFPMTRAGKLDYLKLVSDAFIKTWSDQGELRTPLEAKIAKLWRQLLQLPGSAHIGPKSNFLQLGGSSLLQITLLARLSSKLKAKIPLKIVIQSQSLGELASQLESLLKDPRQPSLGGTSAHGPRKLSPIEQEWWTKYHLSQNKSTSAFNVSFVASMNPKTVDTAAMARAWNTVMARHMIFRGRYVVVNTGTEHTVGRRYAENPPRVHRVRKVDAWAEVNRPFDPANESAIRVTMSADMLAVVLSHTVADLTTLQILLREVKSLYEDQSLPPVLHRYEDSVVVWDEDVSLCDLKFWSEYLDGYEFSEAPLEALSSVGAEYESKVGGRTGYCGASRVYQFSDDLAADMLAFPTHHDLSLQQLAIASVALALQAHRDETDIVIGTPFINRLNDTDMETVGLFLEPLPVRVRHTSTEDNMNQPAALSFLESVRTSANDAIGHAIPWHKLLEHLDVVPRYPDHPLFDVMVTFHTAANGVKLDVAGLEQQMTWAEGAKFSIMTEFTALDDGKVLLRVEYDNVQYSTQSIDAMVSAISKALLMLLSDATYEDVKQKIQAEGTALDRARLREDLFGIRLADI